MSDFSPLLIHKQNNPQGLNMHFMSIADIMKGQMNNQEQNTNEIPSTLHQLPSSTNFGSSIFEDNRKDYSLSNLGYLNQYSNLRSEINLNKMQSGIIPEMGDFINVEQMNNHNNNDIDGLNFKFNSLIMDSKKDSLTHQILPISDAADKFLGNYDLKSPFQFTPTALHHHTSASDIFRFSNQVPSQNEIKDNNMNIEQDIKIQNSKCTTNSVQSTTAIESGNVNMNPLCSNLTNILFNEGGSYQNIPKDLNTFSFPMASQKKLTFQPIKDHINQQIKAEMIKNQQDKKDYILQLSQSNQQKQLKQQQPQQSSDQQNSIQIDNKSNSLQIKSLQIYQQKFQKQSQNNNCDEQQSQSEETEEDSTNNISNKSDLKLDEYSRKVDFCKCKKSRCLKLYCECFLRGTFCNSMCICTECGNISSNEEERAKAIDEAKTRNQDAFNLKFQLQKNEVTHKKGCNCKKTHCLKKYCECFNAGLMCKINCKCEECKNTQDNLKFANTNSQIMDQELVAISVEKTLIVGKNNLDSNSSLPRKSSIASLTSTSSSTLIQNRKRTRSEALDQEIEIPTQNEDLLDPGIRKKKSKFYPSQLQLQQQQQLLQGGQRLTNYSSFESNFIFTGNHKVVGVSGGIIPQINNQKKQQS